MTAQGMDSPLILILVPALGATVVVLLGRLRVALGRWLAVATLLADLFLALNLLGVASARDATFGEAMLAGWQIVFTLRGDALSGLLLVALAVALLAVAYASATLGDRTGRRDSPAKMLVAAAAANGVLLAGDLLTLYGFAVLASLFLALLLLGDPPATAEQAGFKLFAVVEVAGLALPLAIVLALEKGATLDLAAGPALATLGLAGPVVLLAAAARAGLVPLHTWLTETMERAGWQAAAVAGALGGSLGVFVLLRLSGRTALGAALEGMLLALGVATLLVAAHMALRQRDIRHTVAALVLGQGALAALGLGAGNALGVEATLAQLVAMALALPLPFVALGTLLDDADAAAPFALAKAIARRPLAGLALVAGMLALAGLPPFYGFYARVYAVQALVAGGGPVRLLAASVVIVASGTLVAGIVRLLGPVFGSGDVSGARRWWDGRRGDSAPLLLAAVPTLMLAVAPLAWHGGLVWPALRLLGDPASASLVSGLWLSALVLLIALLLGGRQLFAGGELPSLAALPARLRARWPLAVTVERWAEAGRLDPYNWAAAFVGAVGWLVAGALGWLLDRLAI